MYRSPHIALSMLLCLTVLVYLPGTGSCETASPADISTSVVQIFVQTNAIDVFSPWQGQGAQLYFGTGVIIEGNRILTAAHVVTDYLSIEVKRRDHTRKYSAEVEFFAHDCDLAILAVDDPAFFEGSRPIPMGKSPGIEDQVKVYGFPEGGDTLSATAGIVSRIEISTYSHSWRDLLLVQVDAAINNGNSGGPVVTGGKLVGIALQTLGGAENIGYIIPAEIVNHVLVDIRDGRYDGFPDLDIGIQTLENEALREEYGLKGDETGALVREVGVGTPAYGVINPEDVILEIDGYPVAEDLTINVPGLGRVRTDYPLHGKQVGEEITFTLLRKGKRIKTAFTGGGHPPLVPGNFTQFGQSYFVFGGLVFQPLTSDYLYFSKQAVESCYNTDLDYYAYFHNFRTKDRDQIVLLSKVLPAALNKGYQALVDIIVSTVQGKPVKDLKHLVRLIEEAKGPRLKIVMETGEIVVLDLVKTRKENQKILKLHNVNSDRSDDLKL
ncbi:MAG: serine protease [bacterium]|nr:serine protease [bacterium]